MNVSEDEQGTVYFLIRGDRIKVGWTGNLSRRIGELGDTLDDLLCTAEGAYPADERFAHGYLKKWRIRGEWFRATDECLAAIQRLVDVGVGLWGTIYCDDMTPEQRALRARLAAHASWANTADRTARTSSARKAFHDRWEKQVDPDGTLDPAERAKRAASAKSAYYARLALKSSRARRARKAVA